MKTLNSDEIKEELRSYCKELTQKEAASKLGISQQYLSLLLSGTRLISKEIATMLGYNRISTIVYIKSENSEK